MRHGVPQFSEVGSPTFVRAAITLFDVTNPKSGV